MLNDTWSQYEFVLFNDTWSQQGHPVSTFGVTCDHTLFFALMFPHDLCVHV